MNVSFWIVLTPTRDIDGDIVDIKATKLSQKRPKSGNGIGVPVSLDVDEAIFEPVHVSGKISAKTKHVQLDFGLGEE